MTERINPNNIGEVSLQPSARQSSSFAPQYMQFLAGRPDTSNRLRGLSQALNSFSANIGAGFKAKKQYDEQKYNEGIADRLENNKNFNEAIKAGDIHETDSPFYLAGYRYQDLKIRLPRYKQYLEEDYTKRGMHTSNDPKAFHKYLEEGRSTFLQSLKEEGFTSQDFAIMDDQITNIEKGMMDYHINFRKQATVNEMNSMQEIEASDIAESFSKTGDLSSFYQSINVADQSNVSAGTLPSQSKQNIFNGVSSKLEQIGQTDPDRALQIAQKLGDYTFRSGTKLKNDGVLNQHYNTLVNRLRNKSITHDTRMWTIQKKARSEYSRQLQQGIAQKLFDNPRADVSKDINELIKIDPKEALSVMNRLPNLRGHLTDQPTDPAKYSAVKKAIRSGQDVPIAGVEGLSRSDQIKLTDEKFRHEELKEPTKDPSFTSIIGKQVDRLAKVPYASEFGKQAAREKADEYETAAADAYLDFLTESPNATTSQKREALKRIQKELDEIYFDDRQEFVSWQTIKPASSVNWRETRMFGSYDELTRLRKSGDKRFGKMLDNIGVESPDQLKDFLQSQKRLIDQGLK